MLTRTLPPRRRLERGPDGRETVSTAIGSEKTTKNTKTRTRREARERKRDKFEACY
jgi:hypothetical protein